jgi:hypothetical protein
LLREEFPLPTLHLSTNPVHFTHRINFLSTTHSWGDTMTIHPSIREVITHVVREFTSAGRMFTAFEISLAVKDRGIEERHRNMRDTVHEVIFEAGCPLGYTRTLRDVGAPDPAWVYHLPEDNPYRYQPLRRYDTANTSADLQADEPLVLPAGIRNPIKLHARSCEPAQVPPGAYGTDQRGRLCVPVTLLVRLGVSAGQQVQVRSNRDEGKLHLTRPVFLQPHDADTTYTAEPDGNVRITQGTLEKAGINHLPCYKIEGNASQITVSAYDWE